MKLRLLAAEVRGESDVVSARQRGRELAQLLEMDPQDQTRVATAVSEIARNAIQYAGGGRVEFSVEDDGNSAQLVISFTDQGPGIPHLDEILAGTYRSSTGMGVGLIGAKRLMDGFEIKSGTRGGTRIVLRKKIPGLMDREKVQKGIQELVSRAIDDTPASELRKQTVELVQALEAVQNKQQMLEQLNRELEDTNRGVVALYAELDEKAEALRKASSIKTRFLSNMTHEFRSPLSSVIQLSEILLKRLDGPLNEEQEKQVKLIKKAADGLWELVNDLLDIAKVEAGKLQVRPSIFELSGLFASLRGLMKPILTQNSAVQLQIEEPARIPAIFADESKLSQVLRNLLSNALKFTEKGTVELRVSRRGAEAIELSVRDTGIGIAPENHELIFEDFTQIESSLQAKHKGTGLGLPLTRKLVELLGGKLELDSEPGKGSTFRVILPIRYQGPEEAQYISDTPAPPDKPDKIEKMGLRTEVAQEPGVERPLILIIDDREEDRYVLRSTIISYFDCQVIEATTGESGLTLAEKLKPKIAFLDLSMPGMTGDQVFEKWMADPVLRSIPVVIHSAKELSGEERARLAKAAAILSKTGLNEEQLIHEVKRILGGMQFLKKRA